MGGWGQDQGGMPQFLYDEYIPNSEIRCYIEWVTIISMFPRVGLIIGNSKTRLLTSLVPIGWRRVPSLQIQLSKYLIVGHFVCCNEPMLAI